MRALGAAGMVVAAAATLEGQVLLQFDFGTTDTYAGTNSPGHAAGDFGATDTHWNQITGDATSGLTYADGSAASGLTVDLGLGDINAVDWNTPPGFGADTPVGVFTDLGIDNIYTTGGEQAILGVRVTGLNPGTYNVYATGRGVASGQRTYTYNYALGVGDVNSTTFADLGGASQLNGVSDPAEANWVAGETHAYTQLTINSTSDYVVFLTQATGTPAANQFGAIQALQLAAVPEPETTGLLIGLAGLGAGWLARRRGGKSAST